MAVVVSGQEEPMGLNEAQQKAVRHMDGPMMVLAGPGAGKTRVITERVKYLVEQGVRPDSILVITFTKAAAGEMRGRFQALMEGRRLPVTFGTFHGIYFGILKHAYGYTGADILGEDQKHKILKEIVEKAGAGSEDQGEFIADLAAEISSVKNGQIDLKHYYSVNCPEDLFRTVCREYDGTLRRIRKIDFDDMLVLCLELLEKRPDLLDGWQKKFKYLLIDEFQDANRIQYQVAGMLAAPENNLFVVGDDDQSIYRFRGARPEIMLNFPKDYPEARQVLLDVNYRCTPQIVESSLKLIGHNEKRFIKDIRSGRKNGAKVTVHPFPGQKEENETILKLIQKYHEAGVPYMEMAVLYRTNTDPRLLAELLMEHELPFRMKDHLPNLYEHWIARDICAYLRLTEGAMKRGDFLQIANRPKRYISREALSGPEISFQELKEFYEEKDWMCERIDQMEDDIQMLSGMAPFAAVNFIRKGIGYEDYLQEYAEYRKLRPEELFEVLDELQEAARPFKTVEDWFLHMKRYKEELERQEAARTDVRDGVELMTMHSSKGLEFSVVFVIDVNEGVIPYKKAVLNADLEEERRMFYVAMTRAKEKLYLFHTGERYHKKAEPSRFLEELK